MSELQKYHTTIEQSKKLLVDIGLPPESADCYYGKNYKKIHVIDGSIPKSLIFTVGCIPCWSLGRLVSIILECSNVESIKFNKENYSVEKVIFMMENAMDFDFSKLTKDNERISKRVHNARTK